MGCKKLNFFYVFTFFKIIRTLPNVQKQNMQLVTDWGEITKKTLSLGFDIFFVNLTSAGLEVPDRPGDPPETFAVTKNSKIFICVKSQG